MGRLGGREHHAPYAALTLRIRIKCTMTRFGISGFVFLYRPLCQKRNPPFYVGFRPNTYGGSAAAQSDLVHTP